ncbi:Asp23/Gls24 family envelope stress response protein [Gordonia hydrophobica]|uniref:Asp23/Gls24 family envelope stress response protein n=1 Tax=Gordonia hydrophobica TaxID=40516 RepID=A0ABZ2U6M1_9ACTN|nr:Asp23/Gls24 family envelope stress response protein [Gordonia hydrophobica]MBM7366139.1 putative alkaline shock family protein YloU [Gordonia hydrophobica]
MSSLENRLSDDAPLAKQVAQAVLAVPGVVGLDGGLFGEVATYLPGERVSGVQLSDDEGSVHIVVDLRHDLRAVAAQVADAAADLCGVPVSVTVEDVAVPQPTQELTEGESDG